MTKNYSLAGARVSVGDGMIKIETAPDQSAALTLPLDEASQFLAVLATALGHHARQSTGDMTRKYVLPCEWWQVDRHGPGDGLVLSWRLPGGFELSFHLDRTGSLALEETVATLLGLKTPSGPASSRQ